jgi:hypothetical protein
LPLCAVTRQAATDASTSDASIDFSKISDRLRSSNTFHDQVHLPLPDKPHSKSIATARDMTWQMISPRDAPSAAAANPWRIQYKAHHLIQIAAHKRKTYFILF